MSKGLAALASNWAGQLSCAGHNYPHRSMRLRFERMPSFQEGPALVGEGLPACFWKQDRQRTGRPCVGLNGTVVAVPHSEQVVRVSARTRPPPLARLALHCLHRFGSLVNCLSWKNSCSPAVNTNSAPQSMHVNTRSTNSMAGFPRDGKWEESATNPKSGGGPVSLSFTRSITRARAATSSAAN
jgi:hypothetical protein